MLYHHKIGFPVNLTLPRGSIRLTYSQHARNKGVVKLPSFINIDNAQAIEVETDKQGSLVKVLYRVPYDVTDDLLLAVNVDSEDFGFVRTVYLNGRYDNHNTLNRSRYNRP